MISSKSDFIHILMILYVYIALGQDQKTFNRKPLSLRPFVASFKNISLNSDFIHIFNALPHVYTDQPKKALFSRSLREQKFSNANFAEKTPRDFA